jgi:hypothetical protein
MLHLQGVHTVMLELWTKNIDSYPHIFRQSLYNETAGDLIHDMSPQELITVRPTRHDSRLPAQLFSGCLPCITSVPMELYEGQGQDIQMVHVRKHGPILFPNIKTAHLGRDCRWFALHCPSLDLLVDNSRFPNPNPSQISIYGRYYSSLRRIESRITATPQSITGKSIT